MLSLREFRSKRCSKRGIHGLLAATNARDSAADTHFHSVYRYCRFAAHAQYNIRSVLSGTGNRNPIPTDQVPAVAINGWHVARHWALPPDACSPVASKWRRCLSD